MQKVKFKRVKLKTISFNSLEKDPLINIHLIQEKGQRTMKIHTKSL